MYYFFGDHSTLKGATSPSFDPKTLKTTGSILTCCAINSASIAFKCVGKMNIAFAQKSDPTPIAMSFATNPKKTLGSANTANANDILSEMGSIIKPAEKCACCQQD